MDSVAVDLLAAPGMLGFGERRRGWSDPLTQMTSENRSPERNGSESALRLHGDLPDADPASDRLGYAPTAYAIAAAIRANRDRTESFVYGVHGPWGSGKTTVLRYVEHELAGGIDRKELFVVRFNPWWFSGEETLFAVFFEELLAAIGEPLGDTAKGALRQFASGVSGFSGPLKFVMGLVPVLNLVPENARSAVVDALGAMGDETNRSLSETRKVVESALENASFRTLVIIDDIDRLSGDEQLAIEDRAGRLSSSRAAEVRTLRLVRQLTQ